MLEREQHDDDRETDPEDPRAPSRCVTTPSPSMAPSTETAGRDDAVAVEQRRAEEPEPRTRTPVVRVALPFQSDQRHQGQDAALAAIVGPEQHARRTCRRPRC